MAKMTKPGGEIVQPSAPFLNLSVTNQVHIDVDNLAAILDRYEADRGGFFRRIPRLR